MVSAPYADMLTTVDLHERYAHQRSALQIEAFHSIVCQVFVERHLLLQGSQIAPVDLTANKRSIVFDHLQRLVAAFKFELRSEHRMTLDESLKRAQERRAVESSFDLEDDLRVI